MPDWTRPVDVRFDHAAAHDAIEAAAAMRFVLARTWESEDDAARTALDAWEGAAAAAFTESRSQRLRRTRALIDDLSALQMAIEGVVDEAVLGQRRVDELQEAWDAERRAELVSELAENSIN